MTSKQLFKDYQFFKENSGYVVGERAIGAIRMARAYEKLQQMIDDGKARVKWEYDFDTDLSWDESGKVLKQLESGELSSMGCVIELRCTNQKHCDTCTGWHHATSLWGIISRFDAYDNYPKVIEAELASEVL